MAKIQPFKRNHEAYFAKFSRLDSFVFVFLPCMGMDKARHPLTQTAGFKQTNKQTNNGAQTKCTFAFNSDGFRKCFISSLSTPSTSSRGYFESVICLRSLYLSHYTRVVNPLKKRPGHSGCTHSKKKTDSWTKMWKVLISGAFNNTIQRSFFLTHR